jgi:hypothetical protein
LTSRARTKVALSSMARPLASRASSATSGMSSSQLQRTLPPEASRKTTIRVAFDNLLSTGRYEATPAIARGGSGVAWIDRRERFASVVVTAARSTDAVLDVPFDLEVGDRERR